MKTRNPVDFTQLNQKYLTFTFDDLLIGNL